MAAPLGGLAYGVFCYRHSKSLPGAAAGVAIGGLATYLASEFACKWAFNLQVRFYSCHLGWSGSPRRA